MSNYNVLICPLMERATQDDKENRHIRRLVQPGAFRAYRVG